MAKKQNEPQSEYKGVNWLFNEPGPQRPKRVIKDYSLAPAKFSQRYLRKQPRKVKRAYIQQYLKRHPKAKIPRSWKAALKRRPSWIEYDRKERLITVDGKWKWVKAEKKPRHIRYIEKPLYSFDLVCICLTTSPPVGEAWRELSPMEAIKYGIPIIRGYRTIMHWVTFFSRHKTYEETEAIRAHDFHFPSHDLKFMFHSKPYVSVNQRGVPIDELKEE